MEWLKSHLADKYEIERSLGSGGMATVYLARELALDRMVAIKALPRSSMHDKQLVARFEREARLAARLEHPNIVRIYSISEAPDVCYFVMNYISDENLENRLDRAGVLSIDAIIRHGRDICSALAHAHRHEVIHRDLKPANIVFDKDNRAVVTDFGIAIAMRGTRLTQKGTVVGSPEYMSPEQAQGQDLDARSDIYSFGVMLYHMATGRLPFTGPDTVSLSYQHVYVEPERPDTHNPGMPSWLCDLAMACLEKQPANRIGSADELRDILERQDSKASNKREPKRSRSSAVAKQSSRSTLSDTEIGRDWKNAHYNRPTRSRRYRRRRLIIRGAGAILSLIGIGFIWWLLTPAPRPTPDTETMDTPEIAGMIYVPAGWFAMGSDDGYEDEKPEHRVWLDAFYIDKHEVTNAEYKQFCDATERAYPDNPGWGEAYTGYFIRHPDYPVVNVSWGDTNAYAVWAGKRLPTEAEWEKAARGTDKRSYPWGDRFESNRANTAGEDDGYRFASPVGHYPAGASPYGAMDMAGNVWEWVADWFDNAYYARSPERNPTGPLTGAQHVVRGGSLINGANHVRVTNRGRDTPADRPELVGFRCVISSIE